MAIIKPPVLPAWADSGDKTQPTNGEIDVGWPLSATPPSRQRFNWILNFCANAVRYFSRRGISDYDAAETYIVGDRIIGDDGKTYRSLQAANINHTPSTSPTWWERWGFTESDRKRYAFSVNKNNVNQAITGDVVTKITFSTEEFDPDNVFASSTFTCQVAGVYCFTVGVQPATSFLAIIVPIIYKNGVEFRRSGVLNDSSAIGTPVANFTALINLAVGDTIEFYALFNTGTGGALNISGNTKTTHASGFKI